MACCACWGAWKARQHIECELAGAYSAWVTEQTYPGSRWPWRWEDAAVGVALVEGEQADGSAMSGCWAIGPGGDGTAEGPAGFQTNVAVFAEDAAGMALFSDP